jgi:hypothetical protein
MRRLIRGELTNYRVVRTSLEPLHICPTTSILVRPQCWGWLCAGLCEWPYANITGTATILVIKFSSLMLHGKPLRRQGGGKVPLRGGLQGLWRGGVVCYLRGNGCWWRRHSFLRGAESRWCCRGLMLWTVLYRGGAANAPRRPMPHPTS